MSHSMFHLGYFTKFGAPAWHSANDQYEGGDWWNGRYHAELANKLEAACFDFLFFPDTACVSRMDGDMDTDLRYGLTAPMNDPIALLAYLAATSKNIGLVATGSTTFYPPYQLARELSTIDSLSNGRVGWNVVTSSEAYAARNFGMSDLPSPIERYDRADEFLEIVTGLWDSWEDGAVVRDAAAGVYVDSSKVHEIDYRGQYHTSLGPLQSIPSPQKRPVIAQAGASERGREFAARHAEIILAEPFGGRQGMKEFREDMRSRMRRIGRDPKSAKVFFLCPVRFTEKGADLPPVTTRQFEIVRAYFSSFMGINLAKFDPDKPIPLDVEATGHTSYLDHLKNIAKKGGTIRDGLNEFRQRAKDVGLIGTPEEIAHSLAETMDEVGGDGILVDANDEGTPEFVDKLVNDLVPRMQKIGATRAEYSGATFRENLLAF